MGTLLRYPGGKSRLFKELWPLFESIVTDCYAEPFVGGGSTALGVARRLPHVKLAINDLDQDVAIFWSVVCGSEADFRALCEEVKDSRQPTDSPKGRFDYWKKVRASQASSAPKRAFRFLLLNKTTFGGNIDQSPVGGWDQKGWQGNGGRAVMCQYNVDNVLKNLREARQVLAGRTKVYNLDFVDFLDRIEPMPLYADPPYFPERANDLYRVNMALPAHQYLALRLRSYPCPWVLSYNDCEQVRGLYSWAEIFEVSAKYSSAPVKTNWKHKIELIIKSMATPEQSETPLPPPARKVASPTRAVLPDVISPSYLVWAAIDASGNLLTDTISGAESGATTKAGTRTAFVKAFKMTSI